MVAGDSRRNRWSASAYDGGQARARPEARDGEPVPLAQLDTVLNEGARRPATGVMVFAWSGLRSSPEQIEAIGRTFRAMGARQ